MMEGLRHVIRALLRWQKMMVNRMVNRLLELQDTKEMLDSSMAEAEGVKQNWENERKRVKGDHGPEHCGHV